MGFVYFKIGNVYYRRKSNEYVHVNNGRCINTLSFEHFYSNPANEGPQEEVSQKEFEDVLLHTLTVIMEDGQG